MRETAVNILLKRLVMTAKKDEPTITLSSATNCVSLAYKGLREVSRDAAPHLSTVEILDLSHNRFSYPPAELSNLDSSEVYWRLRVYCVALAFAYNYTPCLFFLL